MPQRLAVDGLDLTVCGLAGIGGCVVGRLAIGSRFVVGRGLVVGGRLLVGSGLVGDGRLFLGRGLAGGSRLLIGSGLVVRSGFVTGALGGSGVCLRAGRLLSAGLCLLRSLLLLLGLLGLAFLLFGLAGLFCFACCFLSLGRLFCLACLFALGLLGFSIGCGGTLLGGLGSRVLIGLGLGGGLGFSLLACFFGLGGFGKSNAREYEKKDDSIRFRDVAGEDEAKELLTEMVDYLNHPDKYSRIGAKIPKGALLVGPPGTGKTMLAKAVAGEAGVPFFSISGSEFVEMYVGMGAAKVRDLFDQAKKKSPCIIFIDEIDAIGKKRGAGGLGGNDEREQTLNQLLTEMDGFDSNKAIILLAATNQPDQLDPALLRPGRFDRRVPVELPDYQGRIDILKVHSAKIKMSDNVSLEAIAKAAPGASGAELANIINEAALRAVRAGRERVIQSDLEESIEVVIAGYQKKNKVMTEKEKLIVAYHEVGHALVAALQKDSAPVHKITIIPRTSGALGYTMQVEEEGNHYLYSKEELENEIATLTGGRCAEELIFHTCTTGASNDIERATKSARAMITRYGMNPEVGMVAMEQLHNQYLGGDSSLTVSPETQTKIDEMVVALVKKQHDKAYKLLEDNITKLHEITKFLYERETITGEEFLEILNRKEVDPSVVAREEN